MLLRSVTVALLGMQGQMGIGMRCRLCFNTPSTNLINDVLLCISAVQWRGRL